MTSTDTLTHTYRGHTVTRILMGHAYARSGNAHNPTARYYYRTAAGSVSTLRAAKELIDTAIDMGELR